MAGFRSRAPTAHFQALRALRATGVISPALQTFRPMSSIRDLAGLSRQLRELLPQESLLTRPEELRPFESDGLTIFRRQPRLVALPETEAQVCRILALCYEARVPVVTR